MACLLRKPLRAAPAPCGVRWRNGSQGLALSQLLYSKFTEYLEDFHVWASVHSRPSGRGPLHTPRLSVTFTLLCAHACVAALVVATGHEQVGPFLTVTLVSQPCRVSPS